MSAAASTSEISPPAGEVTRLLNEIRNGSAEASRLLIPLVYGELHRLASRQLFLERDNHTLQTTALVHEAYLKLAGGAVENIQNRNHFLVVASQAMRQILVDSARRRLSKKRGGHIPRVELNEALTGLEEDLTTTVIVNDALDKLEKLDARQARIVEMKFFVGLDIEEIAKALEVSTRTVTREWKTAQAWLYSELAQKD